MQARLLATESKGQKSLNALSHPWFKTPRPDREKTCGCQKAEGGVKDKNHMLSFPALLPSSSLNLGTWHLHGF